MHEYEIGLSEGTVLTSSCVCSGQEAVFRCTVNSGKTTIWHGPALQNCTHGSITLRHSQFDNGITINTTCGTSGQVIGQAISVENGSYTSQLTISNIDITQIIGSDIICATDAVGEDHLQITSSKGIDIYFYFLSSS